MATEWSLVLIFFGDEVTAGLNDSIRLLLGLRFLGDLRTGVPAGVTNGVTAGVTAGGTAGGTVCVRGMT